MKNEYQKCQNSREKVRTKKGLLLMKSLALKKTVAATGIAVMGASAFAGTAFAANTADNTTIDDNATASLTLHKKAGVESTTPATGSEMSNVAGKDMAGVSFDLYKVSDIDLTTNAGLAAAQAVANHNVTTAEVAAGSITVDGKTYTLTKVTSKTTGSNGTAEFADQALGIYVVAENLANSTPTVDGKAVSKSAITPSLPFIVSLPMTSSDGASWNYDVNVYPKNHVDELTKTVLDGNVGVEDQDAYKQGEKITYRLESSILVGDANQDGTVDGKDFGGTYKIIDTLGEGLTGPAVKSVSFKDGATTTALTKDTDYTVTIEGQKTTIALTEAGLTKIAAHSGGTVVADITATVNATPANGSLTNTAYFLPNNNYTPETGKPGIPSNEVTTKYGDVVLKKTDKAGTKALSGAKFVIYRATTGGTCAVADANTPIDTQTTGADGLIAFRNLQLSNFYNGAEQTTLHNYCIQEIAAPSGYALQSKPIMFSLTKEGQVTDLSAAYADTTRDTDVEDGSGANIHVINTLKKNLPVTGAGGYVIMGLVGLGVAGLGGAGIVSQRRKEKNLA